MRGTIIGIVALLTSASTFADAGTLRAAAGELLAALDPAQREAATYPLKADARATWSNLPIAMAPPAGILLGELDDEQRRLVHRMLQTSMSSQGYTKSTAIMWLDDILRQQEKANLETNPEARKNPVAVAMADNRSSGNYAIAIFGNPDDPDWGWKITGHHLGVNVTVNGDRIGALPGFYGSNPRIVLEGPYAGFMALGSESELGMALMRSLTPEQRKAATIGDERPQDILAGPGRRESLKKFEGLSSNSLNSKQLGFLQHLVGEYVRNAKAPAAAEHLDAIANAGWDKLWFSWRGPVDANGEFYYRVHGTRLLIEYNRQNSNHDHSVVRDPLNDYGEDWLGHHYNETHPSPEEYMANLRRAAGTD
jgi:hypothetical protein